MDYSKLSDFEINKRVAIALDIDMHFYIPESEDSFQPGFLPTELGPVWQTSAGFVGEFTVSNGNVFNPCNDPADAWPIIAENRIAIIPDSAAGEWVAFNEFTLYEGDWMFASDPTHHSNGKNPLRCAMECFLMMQDSANVQDNPA